MGATSWISRNFPSGAPLESPGYPKTPPYRRVRCMSPTILPMYLKINWLKVTYYSMFDFLLLLKASFTYIHVYKVIKAVFIYSLQCRK